MGQECTHILLTRISFAPCRVGHLSDIQGQPQPYRVNCCAPINRTPSARHWPTSTKTLLASTRNTILFPRQPYAALLRLRACRAPSQEEPAGVPFPADGLHGMKHPSACQANPVRREGGKGVVGLTACPDLFFNYHRTVSVFLRFTAVSCPRLLALSSRLNTRIQPAREVPILARQPRGHP